MRYFLTVALMAFATPAFAGPHCTDEPESSWLSEAEMMERIAPLGYKVDVFKKTDGNCYEIYGKDGDGKRFEIYFHPVTGVMIKSSSV